MYNYLAFHGYGEMRAEIKFPAIDLIEGQKSIAGSAVGSIREIREMFEFSMKHQITPAIELYSMKEVNCALDRLRENRLRYRAVLVNEK